MSHALDFERPIDEIEDTIARLRAAGKENDPRHDAELARLERHAEDLKREIFSNLTAWQTVQVARHPDRPVFEDIAALAFEEFIELHGDRFSADDRAVAGGFARIGGRRVMLIGNNKGKETRSKIDRRFGMANPEGLRKALRLMKLAEKFGLPVVTIIDIPAAYPGAEAEERGIHEAIARNILEMSRLQTPIVCVVIGEGGSGGALSIGVGDVILMLTHAIYSVAPPETCAAIIMRDSSKAQEAAEAMKLTSGDLLKARIIDEVIEEPPGGAHRDYAATAGAIRDAVLRHLEILSAVSGGRLLEKRFEKYSSIGVYAEMPRVD